MPASNRAAAFAPDAVPAVRRAADIDLHTHERVMESIRVPWVRGARELPGYRWRGSATMMG